MFFESWLDFDLGPLHVNGLPTDGAFFLFPLAYVLGDVISEVYGFRAMRRVIALASCHHADRVGEHVGR